MEESAGIRSQLEIAQKALTEAEKLYYFYVATGNRETIEGQQAADALSRARAAYNYVLLQAMPWLDAIDQKEKQLAEDTREANRLASEKENLEKTLTKIDEQIVIARKQREYAELSLGVAERNLTINEERLSMQTQQMTGEWFTLVAIMTSSAPTLYKTASSLFNVGKACAQSVWYLSGMSSAATSAAGSIAGMAGSLATLGIVAAGVVAILFELWLLWSSIQSWTKFGEPWRAWLAEQRGIGGAEGLWGHRGQYGFQGIVSRPTMFLAGEAGAERVLIEPLGGRVGGGAIMDNRLTIGKIIVASGTDENRLIQRIEQHYRRAILSSGGAIR